MRSVSIGFPSGKAKLTLWEGTEDQENFPIKAMTKNPYVLAYGIKYYLTEEEKQYVKSMGFIKERM